MTQPEPERQIAFDAPWLPRPIYEDEVERLDWDIGRGPWTPERWAKHVRRRRWWWVRWWRRFSAMQP